MTITRAPKRVTVNAVTLLGMPIAKGGSKRLANGSVGYTECAGCMSVVGTHTPGTIGYTFRIVGVGKRMYCVGCIDIVGEIPAHMRGATV
jgi:hypothetical protein